MTGNRYYMTGKGSETHNIADDIERITGCSIGITRLDKSKNIPIYMTVKPMSQANTRGYNMPTAKSMVEKSLLDYLEAESAKSRLLSEWAVPHKQVTTLNKRNHEEGTEGDDDQRPTKTRKSLENMDQSSDKTCILTVPLWVMQSCSKDIDLFCELCRIFLFINCPIPSTNSIVCF